MDAQRRGLGAANLLGEGKLEELAEYTGVDADSILVTNGSDEALALICNTYLDEGDGPA